MPKLESLKKLDRAIEHQRRRFGSPQISPENEEAMKDAFYRLGMVTLLPSRLRTKLDSLFEEAKAKFGEDSRILTRPHLTALFVEGLTGFDVANQAAISFQLQKTESESQELHRERFLGWASLRRGVKDAMQFVIRSELAVLYRGTSDDYGYQHSIKEARAGRANSGEEQARIQQEVAQEIEDLRLLRAGDPTAEKALSLFVWQYPNGTNSDRLIMPLANLGVEQAQMLYEDLFPGTIRFLPDQLIV